MAGYRAAILNFTKGWISPELEARFDLQAYQAGLRVARNVKIRRTGGVAKRMGTRFVTECLGSTARLFPFQFSDEQGYALEYGQAYMRPLALGGMILEDGLKVTAIAQEDNALITTQTTHGYSVGQQVYFTAIPGMVEINDRPLTVTATPSGTTFRVDIDTTNFTPFVATDTGATSPPAALPADPIVPAEADPVPPPDLGTGGVGGYTPPAGDPTTDEGNWYNPYTGDGGLQPGDRPDIP